MPQSLAGADRPGQALLLSPLAGQAGSEYFDAMTTRHGDGPEGAASAQGQGEIRPVKAGDEQWARSRGAALVSLDTNLRSPLSVPFYEDRMGYARHAVIFRKVLRP